MRDKILLAMKSCNPNSPSHSARLLKFQSGNLIGYGGTLCIQVPCGIEAECAFNPEAVVTFFRKDRDGVTYTVNKNKLLIRHKHERVTVPCFESKDMPIIDVFEPVKPITSFLKKGAIKALMDCVKPDHYNLVQQGVAFQRSTATATTGAVILSMLSGLPKSIDCVIPFDTIKFLSTLEEAPNGVAFDGSNLKFTFPSGMSVCTRTILSEGFPDARAIQKAEDGEDLVIHPDLLTELKGLKCGAITVTEKGVAYHTEAGDSFGEIELASPGKFAFSVDKRFFDLMLSITFDNTIRITSTPQAIHAKGKQYFRMTIAQRRVS